MVLWSPRNFKSDQVIDGGERGLGVANNSTPRARRGTIDHRSPEGACAHAGKGRAPVGVTARRATRMALKLRSHFALPVHVRERGAERKIVRENKRQVERLSEKVREREEQNTLQC